MTRDRFIKSSHASVKDILISSFFKANLFYNYGRSVRHGQLAHFVNLNRLDLSYRFKTLHDDF